MKLYSLVSCASVFCALTTVGFSQSNPHTLARPQVMGVADASATAHFNVYLPLTNKAALEQLVADQTNPSSSSYHKWLTPTDFKAKFGPKPSDIAKVKRSLESSGFTIVAEHTQNLEVEGPVVAVEKLLNTQLQQVKMPRGNMRFAAANRPMQLPAEFVSVGAVIPEFAPHLMAHVHSERIALAGTGSSVSAGKGSIDQRLSSADSLFFPNDMKQAYDFPSFTTSVVPKAQAPSGARKQIVGLGTTIGILMSSKASQTNINSSFNSTVHDGSPVDANNYSGNTTLPVPQLVIEEVNGGSGPFDPATNDAAGEASLDTQMSLGTAPGAHEILYDIPDLSNAAIIAGYTQINDENKTDVVSSSFGECELDFTAAANGGTDFTSILQTFHSLFLQGNSQGITFLASSGDNGAAACTSYGFDNNPTNGTRFVLGVENPAVDPNVTGVGGTNLQVAATPTANDSTYVSENANFDPRVPASFQLSPTTTVTVSNNTWGSGGGYSVVFPRPSYQQLVNTGSSTARAVPDISLMMGGCPSDALSCNGPRSAAIIFVGTEIETLIGTSSSSPQMAGVVALSVELAGTRLGNINPQLYALSALQTAGSAKTANLSQFFHRNVPGNNNGYTVAPGQAYSTVLGNGTLFVKNFLQLQSAAPAGTPVTPTNP